MRFYVDASALVAIVASEASSDLVSYRLRNSDVLPLVTDFAHAESSAALAKLARTKKITSEGLDSLLWELDLWTSEFSERPEISAADVADATQHVRRYELALRAPDAIHIAAANRLNATLLTLDKGMARAAATIGVPYLNPAETQSSGVPKD